MLLGEPDQPGALAPEALGDGVVGGLPLKWHLPARGVEHLPGRRGELGGGGNPLVGLGDSLGWFPFPEVDGGQGEPGAMMGGVDGYTCWVNAPKECVDFLNFIVEKQEARKSAKN